MTTTGQHYRVLRTRLLDLAATLTPDQQTTDVPALPAWTVRDTYAHLAGISADIVAAKVGDPFDTAWTAGHVADRRERTLSEICDEWSTTAPATETILDDPAGRRAVFAVIDVFHHTHDIHGALGIAGARDTPETVFVATLMTKLKNPAWTKAGHPPIRLTTGSGSWQLGEPAAEPAAALTTTDYELTRILIGRRSRTQMLAAGWDGDPEPIVDLLPVYQAPVTDLTA